jgi:hypothetical protein
MRKTIPTLGIVSAGLLLAGSPAHAVETDMSSNLNVGIANGIQALLPIQAPVNLCGNAIGLLGSANSYCVGGAQADYASPVNNPVYNPYLFAQGGYGQNLPIPVFPTYPVGGGGPDSDLQSALNAGIANGIQADAKVQAPINLCGNAIGLLGSANAYCADGAAANLFANRGVAQTVPIILPARNTAARPAHTNARPTAGKPAVKPTGAKPAARPNAAKPPIKPTAAKQTGVKSTPTKRGVAAKPGKKTEGGLLANLLAPVTGLLTGGGAGGGFGGERCGDVDMSTFGNIGAANGIQAHAPIQVPINLTGNAIGLLGSATGLSTAGANANYCS